ncbi:MAG: SagB/ThcOx family dehydrogenase [Thermoanaerobaculia bacterium]
MLDEAHDERLEGAADDLGAPASGASPAGAETTPVELVRLLDPSREGGQALASALARRRSTRHWPNGRLRLDELSQLLWAAQGVTKADGLRAAPSAGAIYPLLLDVVVGEVGSLAGGIYRYRSGEHALEPRGALDEREALSRAAFGQTWVATGAAVIAVSADSRRTARRYGARGERYVHFEVGGVAENLYLQAAALGLGTVLVAAFDDDAVARILALAHDERPMALMPIGRLIPPRP